MANKKLFWLICIGIVSGFILLGFSFSKKILPPAQPVVTIPIVEPIPETTAIFTLRAGDTMKPPAEWSVKILSSEQQFQNYVVTTPDNEFPLTEITVSEWLSGPSIEEADVISHEKRPQALKILQNLYDHGQISSTDRTAFLATAGEFLGYSDTYRSALTYITSTDNTFRGISFYNLIGQDVGVSPIYYVVLYNPTSETIVFANYYLAQSTREVTATNSRIRAIDWTKNNNDARLAKLDLEAREQFQKLVEETPRKDLSFGAALDAIDEFMRTTSHTP
jgi:hypothetical protein